MKQNRRNNKDQNIFLKRRIQLGLSQSAIAEELGYTSPQFVSNWERGLCNPPLDRMAEISKILKLSKKEILDYFVSETIQQVNEALSKKRRRS